MTPPPERADDDPVGSAATGSAATGSAAAGSAAAQAGDALTVLHAAIAATPGVRVPLRRDEAVIVDNRRVLHARESFRDPHRHLLRVRMTADAVRGTR